MDGHLLRIFQSELRTQCEFVRIGAVQVDAGLQNMGSGNTLPIWFGVQGILVSASNASKLLWGSRRAPVLEERRLLRESVGVSDASPLSSRRLRNDFEHFDERLTEWFSQSANHNYVGRNIGPSNMIVINGAPPTDQFGQFDPQSKTVSFWDRSACLSDIVREAARVLHDLSLIGN